MSRTLARALIAVAALAWAPASARAQDGPAATAPREREETTAPWRVGVFIGGAHDSRTDLLGVTPGRDHRFLGLDAETLILRLGPVHVNYAVQLLPYVTLSGRAAYPAFPGQERFDLRAPEHAYAWGLSPFGFEIATSSASRVSVFAAAAAGALVFNHPYPIEDAQRFNFTLEYGGGALVRVGQAHWIRAGYKYHHLSNAYTAKLNPGVDGNVFYGGYQWAVRLPR